MKGIIFLMSVVVLISAQAYAVTDLDKAVDRCKGETTSYVENVLKGEVRFPTERFSSENNYAYFIHYKEDLKTMAFLKDGSVLPLDIRCTIEKNTFKPVMVSINGNLLPIK
ncbi:MAG: hypothetical protein SCH71_12645 [Desulfobulbaceae bacterium]|nr:hypothetical protein [Desulfobulbaceae bacterium]